MKNLVADLSYCEQFEKLNIKFKTVFYWTDEDIVLMPETVYDRKWKVTTTKGLYKNAKYIPAPTASEIMEMLKSANADIIYHIDTLKFGLEILDGKFFSDEIEADARAKCLIYLKKEKLIN